MGLVATLCRSVIASAKPIGLALLFLDVLTGKKRVYYPGSKVKPN